MAASGEDLTTNTFVGSPEESALLAALRRGDEDAFARLVQEHHARLRRVARLYVANAAIADEVVQDTWLGVIRGIWAFEGRSSLKTWIFRILVNRARTRAKNSSAGSAASGCCIRRTPVRPLLPPWRKTRPAKRRRTSSCRRHRVLHQARQGRKTARA